MSAAPTLHNAHEILSFRAKLSDVYARYAWNARSEMDLKRVVSDDLAGYNPETEGTGMGGFRNGKAEPGLIELIVNQGQLDPCDVRPNPAHAENPNQPPYEVTAGFRRHYALTRIAKHGVETGNFHPIVGDPTWDARDPTILVVLKRQTNKEARRRNIVENAARANLSTPDLAHGVLDLYRCMMEENRGRKPTGDEVGREIGKSGKYVGNLLRVMTQLPEVVTKHWREGGEAWIAGQRVVYAGSLPVDQMVSLAGLPLGSDFESAYVKLVMGTREEKEADEKKSASERKFKDAMDHAAELGELMAFLGHEGIDPANVKPAEWGLIIEEFVDYEAANAEQLDLLARRLSASYEEERKSLSDPEDGGGDEEAIERKRQARDGGR